MIMFVNSHAMLGGYMGRHHFKQVELGGYLE